MRCFSIDANSIHLAQLVNRSTFSKFAIISTRLQNIQLQSMAKKNANSKYETKKEQGKGVRSVRTEKKRKFVLI